MAEQDATGAAVDPMTLRDVTALLRTIYWALDLPHPATVDDEPAYYRVQDERALWVVSALQRILSRGLGSQALDLNAEVKQLASNIGKHPPSTYRHAPRQRCGGAIAGP